MRSRMKRASLLRACMATAAAAAQPMPAGSSRRLLLDRYDGSGARLAVLQSGHSYPVCGQKHACANNDEADDSRGAIGGWRETFDSDACRDDAHCRQVHDAEDEQDCGQAGAAAGAVDTEAHAMSPRA